MELLRLRGGSATDDAARWGTRILESKIVGVVGDALIKERIAVCYASKNGTGSAAWGSRTRKSALWTVLAADAWLTIGKPAQSKRRLAETTEKYASLSQKDSLSQFTAANEFLQSLRKETQLALYPETAVEGPNSLEEALETEAIDIRPHRRSLMGASVPPIATLGSAPLQGTLLERDSEPAVSDQFE